MAKKDLQMKIILTLFPFLFAYYFYYIWIFINGLNKKYFHATSEQPFVSVIVAARNEEKNIHNLLTSLVNQDYPENSYEIIIANDQSKDSTAEIVRKFQKKFTNLKLVNVKVFEDTISRKKNALSQAINVSKGKIILTTDGDCIVKSTWISGMVKYFGKNVGMVAGFSVPNIFNWKKTNFTQKYEFLDSLALFSAAAGSSGMNKIFSCSGQNLAYKKQVYSELGGFEKIKNFISGDDILLMHLIKNKDYQIRFAFGKDTFNLTKSEKSFKNFLNQRIRWASNAKPMFSQNREFSLYLVDVFLLNFLILAMLFFQPIYSLGMLIIKGLVDFAVVKKGQIRFGIPKNRLYVFPIWELLQPIYILFVGICGRLNLFKW